MLIDNIKDINDIKDVPIITYCAHSKCDASEQLINHMYECKINNILEWKKGIKEWNKIKYGNDKGNRIVICTLKPKGTVTTAPKIKE